MARKQDNQGEGNREAARRYNEKVRETLERGPDDDPAPHSEQESAEMQEAEKAGRERAKEYDPAVRRDRSKGA